MTHQIKKYDKGSTLPSEAAEQVVQIFKQNYPNSHTAENREKDLAERANETALNALLAEGRVIFSAHDIHNKIVGLLEMREVDQGEGIYIQMAWIIVDALARGKGIAFQLHEAFKAEAENRAKQMPKPSCLLLAVHPDNPAKKLYESWGYIPDGRTDTDGKVFMYKSL